MKIRALEKKNRINMLFDFYEQLLTEKQQTFLKYYFHDDYSLGEIAADLILAGKRFTSILNVRKLCWRTTKASCTCWQSTSSRSWLNRLDEMAEQLRIRRYACRTSSNALALQR